MTTTTTTTNQRRLRATVPLKGTAARTSAQLDHTSALALEWAQHWLQAADSIQRRPAGLKVPASGVIRRALRLYVQHLEAASADIYAHGWGPSESLEEEVRQVHRCCTTSTARLELQEASVLRLHAIQPEDLPPPLIDVLYGPGAVADADRMTQDAERLAAQAGKRGPRGPR